MASTVMEQASDSKSRGDPIDRSALRIIADSDKFVDLFRTVTLAARSRHMADRADVRRIDLPQALNALICLVKTAEPAQGPAQASPTLLRFRRKLNRPPKARLGTLAIIQAQERRALCAMEKRIVRLQCERPIVAIERLVEQPEFDQLSGELAI